MPRGDRRGPGGMGSMSGRAAGFCGGSNVPGFINTGKSGGYGKGAGKGFNGRLHGRSRGFGHGSERAYGMVVQPPDAVPAYSKEAEKNCIENEVSYLKNQLKNLEARLAEMQGQRVI